MTIRDWTLKTSSGVEIASVMNFTPASDRTKILTRLYNGQYLAQTIGQVMQRPSVTLLVDSQDKLAAVNAAEAECAVLTLHYKDRDYTGYIVSPPRWTPLERGSIYRATIEFAVIDA